MGAAGPERNNTGGGSPRTASECSARLRLRPAHVDVLCDTTRVENAKRRLVALSPALAHAMMGAGQLYTEREHSEAFTRATAACTLVAAHA